MIIPFHVSGVETVFSKNTSMWQDQGELALCVSVLCPIEVAILLLWHLFLLVSIVTAYSPHSGVYSSLMCAALSVQIYFVSPLSSYLPLDLFPISPCAAALSSTSLDQLLEFWLLFQMSILYRIRVNLSTQSLSLFLVHPPPATIQQQLPGVTQLCLSAPSYPGHRVHQIFSILPNNKSSQTKVDISK